MGGPLIAVDVDGTLLRSDGTISERTRAALAGALARGATLAVATGRRRRTALPILNQLALPHYLVASQGAVTWWEHAIVDHAHLSRAAAAEVLALLERNQMQGVIFSNAFQEEEVIWAFGDWRANDHVAGYFKPPDRAELRRDLDSIHLEADPIEILVFDTMDRLEALDEQLTGHVAPPPSVDPPAQPGPTERRPRWRVIFSRNQFTTGGAIEVVGPDTSKARSLGVLCERLGITPADVIAFGDNVNDVEMLAFAGQAYAMANGTPDAKRAARGQECPSNNDDGIAVTLERLGLS
jgi:HAD superfamily hydrolase (TIGR01484 family)